VYRLNRNKQWSKQEKHTQTKTINETTIIKSDSGRRHGRKGIDILVLWGYEEILRELVKRDGPGEGKESYVGRK